MVFRAFFEKLKAGLTKTRGVFSGIGSLLRLRGKVDRDFLTELEKRLYLADVGTGATSAIVEKVRQSFLDKEVTGDVEAFVKQQLKEMLTAGEGLRYNPSGPTVVMVAGVNGSGKTTSIAKLARLLQSEGKKVLVAACDTQTHLMRELEKIHRVVTRQIEGAPHEVLLVLDATTGQNAIAQAENFKKTVQCTGIILAKLDGTAKGGAIFAIKQKLGLPVKFVGVGEKLDDLEPFDPDSYVEALFA